MASYKGIVFAKGFNHPFALFKEMFASNHIFMKIPENKREAELKRVHRMVIKESKKLEEVETKNVLKEDKNKT